MKDYQLTIIKDSVTLEVPLHEQHLIPELLRGLLSTQDLNISRKQTKSLLFPFLYGAKSQGVKDGK